MENTEEDIAELLRITNINTATKSSANGTVPDQTYPLIIRRGIKTTSAKPSVIVPLADVKRKTSLTQPLTIITKPNKNSIKKKKRIKRVGKAQTIIVEPYNSNSMSSTNSVATKTHEDADADVTYEEIHDPMAMGKRNPNTKPKHKTNTKSRPKPKRKKPKPKPKTKPKTRKPKRKSQTRKR